MREYRRIFKKHYGEIPEGYHVHHLDGDSSNNSPDNIIAVSKDIHLEIHTILWNRYGNPKDRAAVTWLSGETPSGWKHSAESKEKISKSLKGNKNNLRTYSARNQAKFLGIERRQIHKYLT